MELTPAFQPARHKVVTAYFMRDQSKDMSGAYVRAGLCPSPFGLEIPSPQPRGLGIRSRLPASPSTAICRIT